MGLLSANTALFWSVLVLLSLPWVLNQVVEPGKAKHVPSYLDHFNRPVILCHRGSRYMGPENSIHMHRQALLMGCDVLEFDVRLTKDKQLVVHHDPTLDRTANIKGSIDQFTFAELQILDSAYQYTPKGAGKGPYLDSDFPFRGKGYKLPLFSTFMDAFEDAYKNIEIKDNDPLAAQLVWQELQRRPKLLNNVIVASGHCEVLRSFREISGGVVATSACEKEGLAFFVTHKLGIGKFWFWLFPPTAVAYQAPVVSSGVWLNFKYFVDAAHSMNQKLMYWVINDGELASELLDLGADGIVSDRADLIYHAYHTRGIVPTSLQERLANVIVNSSSSFYIPESNPREVHTCLSLGCRILPVIMNYFAPIALFLIVSFYLLIRKRAPVKIPVEPEIHNRGANPKSKGKRKVD